MNTLEIITGAYDENCILAWGDSNHAVVVDPGADAENILGELEKRKLTLSAVFLTHGHIDHVSALDGILAATPSVPVYMHPADSEWAFTFVNRLPGYMHVPDKPQGLRDIADGETIDAGGMSFRVIHTPGHSKGSVCFHAPDAATLFAGDTLFAGSVGRTDFPGGSRKEQLESLAKLMELPAETKVFTGHGPSTTIGEERASNPYI